MIERITSLEKTTEDQDAKIRPERLDDFIGQEQLKSNMWVYIRSALKRKDVLDHTLLSGPPGLGKTTLSQIISKEMRANFRSTTAPVIEKTGEMAAILSSLKAQDVLFIDEIHRLKPVVEEILYSAMEDGYLDLSVGQGAAMKSVKISLPPFTLIGATTKPGALTQPLISRFGIIERFNFYELADLEEIATNNIGKLNLLPISKDGISEIAKRSRGTPRVLNRLLRRVRDFSEVDEDVSGEGNLNIDGVRVASYLAKMNIDKMGLEDIDHRILKNIINLFGGGPVGVDNLATSLGEDAGSIEDVYEPFLIQKGLIKRTPRGRMVTDLGYQYLGLPKKANLSNSDSEKDSINLLNFDS